jgi:hypothetical protein
LSKRPPKIGGGKFTFQTGKSFLEDLKFVFLKKKEKRVEPCKLITLLNSINLTKEKLKVV